MSSLLEQLLLRLILLQLNSDSRLKICSMLLLSLSFGIANKLVCLDWSGECGLDDPVVIVDCVCVVAEDLPGDSVSRQKYSGDCVLASLKDVSAVWYEVWSSSSGYSDLNKIICQGFRKNTFKLLLETSKYKISNKGMNIVNFLPFSFYSS